MNSTAKVALLVSGIGALALLGIGAVNYSSKLGYADLVQLAIGAGFDADTAQTMAGIALAESSGNPAAVGDKNLAPAKGPSIGLWQINIGSREHPNLGTAESLTDPQANANAAFAIFQQQGLGAWTTYTTGAYLKYVPAPDEEQSA